MPTRKPRYARAVIFDLDGTLADTLADIADAANHVLAERGFATHPREAYKNFVGQGVTALLELAMPGRTREDVTGVLAAFRSRYDEHMLDQTRAYPGIDDLLGELCARGVPIAVLSNKHEPATRRIVDALFGRYSFVDVAGQTDGAPRKPDPQRALAIARRMGVPASECLFVGDSGVDMQTGKNSGMRPVGVLWGFRQREELEADGADVCVHAPAELLFCIGLTRVAVP